jgi:hypothetical protein
VEYERFLLRLTMDIERCLSCGLKSWSEQENLLTLPLQTADKAVRALVLYSKDLSTLPALPTTQLGRFNYLSNMGSNWRTWIWFTSPPVVQEDTPFSNEGIHESRIHNNGKDGSSQSTPISYGAMAQNIPSEEIVTHIFMSAWTCQCNGTPHMQGKGEY